MSLGLLSKPYLQPRQFAGSSLYSTGSMNRLGETEGKVLKKIQVSLAGNALCGIQVWLTGDSTPSVLGDPNKRGATHRTFEFTEGERITKLSLQSVAYYIGPNFIGTTVLHIRFETSGMKVFEHGVSSGHTIEVNVGSGVCVGVVGNSNGADSISRLGFVFLKPIKSARLSIQQYPNISTTSITTTILGELASTTKNEDEQPLHWVLAGSRQFVTTSNWVTQPAEGLVSHLHHHSLNVDLGIRVPVLVPTDPPAGNFHWEARQTFPRNEVIKGSVGDLTISTDQYSVWCHISDTLAPAQSLTNRAAALVAEGTISKLQCSANIQVFIDLYILSFPVQVLYSGRAHSDVQILN